MYPFKRFIKTLKEYVWIHARLEDSIAKGYVVKKELTICSKYLKGVEIEFNGPKRNLNLSGDSKIAQLLVFKSIGDQLEKPQLFDSNKNRGRLQNDIF